MQVRQFTTQRLRVHDWRPIVADASGRQEIEDALASILTPRVLTHLPKSLKLDQDGGTISSWVTARIQESDVLLVEKSDTGLLVGLMFLASELNEETVPIVHLGYLLDETSWGKGIATELVSGFVAAMAHQGPVDLIGGVDIGNLASVRVLQKAGFVLDTDRSMPGVNMYIRRIA